MNALTQIREKQMTGKQKRFKENFEVANEIGDNGSRKLSSWGCYQRHNLPRNEMQLTQEENRQRNFELTNRAEREESRIQNQLWQCLHLYKMKLKKEETVEELIERAKEDGYLIDSDRDS